MNKLFIYIFLLLNLVLLNSVSGQRFPKPEFEKGHTQPELHQSPPRMLVLEYVDVIVLIVALSIASYLIIKKRSRRGIFWLSVFSLLYFGFYREGCVCSIGAIQNVTLALFNPNYNIPITTILFFILPLIYTLFYGRTFCSGVCPLGAIQDLIVFKPIELKKWTQAVLRIIPYIYLSLSVLYAATASDFIICKYDPFVGFFRLDAKFYMFLLGGGFLISGMFIARPYCRFFCPYGLILNWLSRFSKYHMQITPTTCIQCRLCENSCPFDAIDKPEELNIQTDKIVLIRKYLLLILIIPSLIFIGGYTGRQMNNVLAKVNPTVQLAEEIFRYNIKIKNQKNKLPENIEVEGFKASGKTEKQLFTEASVIIEKFKTGGMLVGGFLGLAIGLMLANLSVYKYRKNYTPNKGECFSCGRCINFCPIKIENNIKIIIKKYEATQ